MQENNHATDDNTGHIGTAQQRKKTTRSKGIMQLHLLQKNPFPTQDIRDCQTTLAEIRQAIDNLPSQPRKKGKKPRSAGKLLAACEDCRAIKKYSRIMRMPIAFLRQIARHEHNGQDMDNERPVDINQIRDSSPTPDQQLEAKELWDAVETLQKRKAEVVRYRFEDDMTIRQICQRLHCTKKMAIIILEGAIRDLRENLTAKAQLPLFDPRKKAHSR